MVVNLLKPDRNPWHGIDLTRDPFKLSEISLAIGCTLDVTNNDESLLHILYQIRGEYYHMDFPFLLLKRAPQRTYFFRNHIHPLDMQYFLAPLHITTSHVLSLMFNPENLDEILIVLWIDADTTDPQTVMVTNDHFKPPLDGLRLVEPTESPDLGMFSNTTYPVADPLYWNLSNPAVSDIARRDANFLKELKESTLYQCEYKTFKLRRFWHRYIMDYNKGIFRVDLLVTHPRNDKRWGRFSHPSLDPP